MRRKTELRGRAARLARLLPAGPGRAARTPFVLLIVVLLSGGLLTLLMLNSSLNEGSFELSKIKKQTTDLTDEEQALQREVSGYEDPSALERRARGLGMVPGGDPAFLSPDGTVRGVPGAPAPAPEPPPRPTGTGAGASPGASGATPSGATGTGTTGTGTTATGKAGAHPDPEPTTSTLAR
jgi:hypothetical protein